MINYIIRRLLTLIPLLLIMSFVTFMFIQLSPGNMLAQYKLNPLISEETVARLEKQYHFDKPVIVQYGYWLKNLLVLNLGYSESQKQPVIKVISSRLVNTLLLSITTILITWIIAIPIGIYCAVHQYTIGDKIFSAISFVGMSLPSFFMALLFLYFFGSQLGILPIGGLKSADFESLTMIGRILDMGTHLIIPAMVLVIGALAGLQRIMRGNMLDVLRMQYVTTARAKGLPESKVIYKHALRNAINPMVTIFGYELSSLLSGAALVEIICSYPGLGQVMLEAVRSKDIYLVMGSMMISGFLLIMGNLIADILLAVVDPQIQYQ